jgi:hypothetical protein
VRLPEASNVSKKITKNKVELPSIDATPKLYVGGKQKRPDSGYSLISYQHKKNLFVILQERIEKMLEIQLKRHQNQR